MSTEILSPVMQMPKGDLLLGHLGEFRRDPLGFVIQCARAHGDIVPLRFGPLKMYALSHPALIEEALVKNHRAFARKGRGLRSNTRLLGNGVFISEGDFYRQQRRLMQPAFHRERVAAYSRIMVEETERMLDSYRDGGERDIYEDLIRLTMAIVAKTLLGVDVTSREASPVSGALAATMEHFRSRSAITFLIPDWIPTRSNLRYRRAIADFNRVIYGIINSRRRGRADRGDLLSELLNARYDDGGQMTDRQLRDEVVNIFLAGHETTALVLAWTIVCLDRNPLVEERLLAELDGVLGARAPTFADLPKLRYTESVVLETMRLYPPVWLITREAVADCEIGGCAVRRGSSIMMSQWALHRDPRFYENPERFDPDRWMDGLQRRLPTGAYFPFSLAARACIGKAFGMTEAVLLVATIMQRFQFRLSPGHPIEIWPSLTLRPRHGVRVQPLRRRPGGREGFEAQGACPVAHEAGPGGDSAAPPKVAPTTGSTGRRRSGSALPPSPRRRPLGNLLEFRRNHLDYLVRAARERPDIAYFKLGPQKVFLVSHPDYIKQVLVNKHESTIRGPSHQAMREIVLGNGLLTTDGEFHHNQRRLAQPAFLRKRIATYVEVMTDYALRMRDGWREGTEVPVDTEMMRLSLAILTRTLISADIEGEERHIGRDVKTVLEGSFKLLANPLAFVLSKLGIPMPRGRELRHAQARLDEVIFRIIGERRRSGEHRDDFLAMLLRAQDEQPGGGPMSDQQVRDEAMTILLAGQETIGVAMTWTWYLLSQNPEAEARFHAEVDALGGRTPGAEDYPRLEYTNRVLMESMRMYPPVWAVGRFAAADFELGEHVVPKGALLMISPYVTQHDPRWYSEPDKFDPDRWLPQELAKRPRLSYLPFFVGPNRCIGEHYAMLEGVFALATVAQRWRLRLAPGQRVEKNPLITLHPKHGMRMIPEPRGIAAQPRVPSTKAG